MHRIYKSCKEYPEFVSWLTDVNNLYFTDQHFMYREDLFKVSKLGIRRRILAESFKDPIMRNLRDIVLDAVMSADQKTPGAGIWVPYFLLEDMFKLSPKRAGSEHYLNSTLSLTNSQEAKDVFKTLWGVCGPLTRISLKRTKTRSTVVRYKNSFQFKLKLDSQFHQMIGNTEFVEMSNPNIIMIEGSPETVSEINLLLEENHNTAKPCVLIARSFPEEISATLATNWLKGTLNILPIVYGTEIETINLAADMCSVTKGELVSPVFGDVISVAVQKPDKRGTCDRIEWQNNRLKIFKDIDVSRHIQSLLSKIELTDNEELQEIISDRVTSLSNDSIELEISDQALQLAEELDMLIKHYNSFVVSGYSDSPLGVLPTSILQTSQEVAKSFRQEILKIAGFLIKVSDEKSLETK